jgi:hypothetical protein
MKSSARSSMFAAVATVFASVPSIVHACPMCFAGGSENTDAFVYGSLFLMIVPSTMLGGLGYWVYRRVKALDAGLVQPDADEAEWEQEAQSGSAVVLPMPSRR